MTATVIIPTTGSSDLKKAIESVLNQTYPTNLYLVIDGPEHEDKVDDILNFIYGDLSNTYFCTLGHNVGANGFYGHRIYAAFSHLINESYVFFLDQDNWFEPDHVESLINTIKTNNYDKVSRRKNIKIRN